MDKPVTALVPLELFEDADAFAAMGAIAREILAKSHEPLFTPVEMSCVRMMDGYLVVLTPT